MTCKPVSEFELDLLAQLGYEIVFDRDAQTGHAMINEAIRYRPQQGPEEN